MAYVFSFKLDKGFNFSTAFAEHFNLPVIGDKVIFSENIGKGFIKQVRLKSGLVLSIHSYVLVQPLFLERLESNNEDTLVMKFDCRRFEGNSKKRFNEALFLEPNGCDIEFGTGNVFKRLRFPAHHPILFAVITTTRKNLINLLDLTDGYEDLRALLANSKSFVLHEFMCPSMERTLKLLSEMDEGAQFSQLLYQAHTQELIYHLFSKLVKRNAPAFISLAKEDIQKMYEVRNLLISSLETTPRLSSLSRRVGINQTKMKELFHIIFGDSIYQYYQKIRMNEAAHLLQNYNVSEVGYKLGFSNLSHFGRLFEKHLQMKPKRYKDTLLEVGEGVI